MMEEEESATEHTAILVSQPQQVHKKFPIEAIAMLGCPLQGENSAWGTYVR